MFLSKDADDTTNPLAYRGLKITSALYRKWASTRLKALEQWIDSWDHPALHVIGGKGAQDAWLFTALRTEIAQLEGQNMTGGSIDIF